MGKLDKAIEKVKKEIEKNVNKGYDKKLTWTLYFLVDIKVIYIVFYAYISIINLISSTANVEATEDRQSTLQFPITSTNTGYVTEISDAVLWNCRDHSVSSHYYKSLYLMLLITLVLSLSGFLFAKMFMLWYVCYAKHGLTRMWNIAKLKAEEETPDKTAEEKEIPDENEKEKIPDKTEEIIPDEILKDIKWSNIGRVLIPFLVLVLVISGIMLSFLSYDLHLLLCIGGIPQSSIQYYSEGNRTGRVDFDLPDKLLNFQLGAAITVALIILVILLLALAFRLVSKRIIEDMEKYQMKKNDVTNEAK